MWLALVGVLMNRESSNKHQKPCIFTIRGSRFDEGKGFLQVNVDSGQQGEAGAVQALLTITHCIHDSTSCGGRLEAVSSVHSLPHTAMHLRDMMLHLMTSGMYELRLWSCATKIEGPTYIQSNLVNSFVVYVLSSPHAHAHARSTIIFLCTLVHTKSI